MPGQADEGPSASAVKRPVVVFLATGAYLGYAPVASGTFGTLAGVALYPVFDGLRLWSVPIYLLTFAALVAVAIWLAGEAERIFEEHDSGKITIDEVAGYIAATFFMRPTVGTVLASFFLFRLFDVARSSGRRATSTAKSHGRAGRRARRRDLRPLREPRAARASGSAASAVDPVGILRKTWLAAHSVDRGKPFVAGTSPRASRSRTAVAETSRSAGSSLSHSTRPRYATRGRLPSRRASAARSSAAARRHQEPARSNSAPSDARDRRSSGDRRSAPPCPCRRRTPVVDVG